MTWLMQLRRVRWTERARLIAGYTAAISFTTVGTLLVCAFANMLPGGGR